MSVSDSDGADYCFHEVIKAQYELIELGYDETEIKSLSSYTFPALGGVEAFSRDTVNENAQAPGDEGTNQDIRKIRITEHYVRMDYEQDGKPRLYKVVTGGEQGKILTRDGKPDIEPADVMPFAAMTPVIVTHRFFGRSIADLVIDIQRIKTALLRGLLDNAYLSNNPRVEVSEAHATDTTLDDLLVSRPGGIVRTKMPGGINWQVVPNIGANIYPLLEYLDGTREWRTGMSKQGQGLDPNALQNQTATAANLVFTAAQAKMKLIARIFAETGIRDVFLLLHGIIRKHGSEPETVRLRNQWVPVDPRNWRTRNDMTINVGLGDGGKTQQLAHLMTVIEFQKQALEGGKTNLVTDENLFHSAEELTKLVGLKAVDRYFTDPKGQPAPQPAPDPKMIEAQGKMQLQAQAQQHDQALAQQQAQTDLEAGIAKAQVEAELKRQQIAAETQLKREQMLAEMALKTEQMNREMALKEQQMQMEHQFKMHSLSLGGNDSVALGSPVRMGGEVG